VPLLGIPARQHHGSARPLPVALELSQHARQLELGRRAARGVDRSVDPRVAVIAQHHALLGKLRAAHPAAHHPDRADLVVHPHHHAQLGRPGTRVISDGQSPLPVVRRQRATQRLEDRLHLSPRHRNRRDARHRTRLCDGNALCIGQGGPARRERIARHQKVVGDRAALDVALRPPGAVRENLSLLEAVFHRVGVDEHRPDPAPLRLPRLEPAIAVGIRVADHGDLAAWIDPLTLQPVVVLGVAAVRVDHLAGNVARGRHAEVGRADVGIPRVLVDRDAVLTQRRLVGARLEHLHPHLPGPGQQHVVAVELDVLEPVLDEAVAGVERELVVLLAARGMRLLRQVAEVPRHVLGLERASELVLDGELGACAGNREARDRALAVLSSRRPAHNERRDPPPDERLPPHDATPLTCSANHAR
jgi:hypothetical protein